MSDDPSSKIIVDDDWKSQVEKDKHAVADDVTLGDAKSDADSFHAPPDASFETLLTMLFTQGMAALGQVPGDDSKPMPVNKVLSKYFIDTIEMLGEKTKGNLSEEETSMHSEILHAMRMMFVQTKAPK